MILNEGIGKSREEKRIELEKSFGEAYGKNYNSIKTLFAEGSTGVQVWNSLFAYEFGKFNDASNNVNPESAAKLNSLYQKMLIWSLKEGIRKKRVCSSWRGQPTSNYYSPGNPGTQKKRKQVIPESVVRKDARSTRVSEELAKIIKEKFGAGVDFEFKEIKSKYYYLLWHENLDLYSTLPRAVMCLRQKSALFPEFFGGILKKVGRTRYVWENYVKKSRPESAEVQSEAGVSELSLILKGIDKLAKSHNALIDHLNEVIEMLNR